MSIHASLHGCCKSKIDYTKVGIQSLIITRLITGAQLSADENVGNTSFDIGAQSAVYENIGNTSVEAHLIVGKVSTPTIGHCNADDHVRADIVVVAGRRLATVRPTIFSCLLNTSEICSFICNFVPMSPKHPKTSWRSGYYQLRYVY